MTGEEPEKGGQEEAVPCQDDEGQNVKSLELVPVPF